MVLLGSKIRGPFWQRVVLDTKSKKDQTFAVERLCAGSLSQFVHQIRRHQVLAAAESREETYTVRHTDSWKMYSKNQKIKEKYHKNVSK